MGTELDISIISDYKPANDFNTLNELFTKYENKFSRFIEDSELSILNRDKYIYASDELIETLLLAKKLFEYTNRIFNPLTSPISLGYTTNFDNLDSSNIKQSTFGDINFQDIIIDTKKNYIELKNTQYIDFGGFLKGYVSQLAANTLEKYTGAIINLGGDITCIGKDIGNIPFKFEIAHPINNDDTIGTVELYNESLATSSIVKRNWINKGNKYHHIVDPRSKNSSKNNLLSVTVLHEDGAYTDALATTGIIYGLNEGLNFFEKNNIKAIFITDKMDIIPTSLIQDRINILI